MKLSVRRMAVAGLLGAVCIAMGSLGIGFIPVPTAAGSATIMHIPVILGAVAEGPLVGSLVGLIFGIFSLLRATAPMFADPLVAMLPRICIGITSAYAFMGVRRFGLATRLVVTAVVGTATNTILVLGLSVMRGYLPGEVALVAGFVHGLPEIVVAALVTTAIGLALARAGYIKGEARGKRAA